MSTILQPTLRFLWMNQKGFLRSMNRWNQLVVPPPYLTSHAAFWRRPPA